MSDQKSTFRSITANVQANLNWWQFLFVGGAAFVVGRWAYLSISPCLGWIFGFAAFFLFATLAARFGGAGKVEFKDEIREE